MHSMLEAPFPSRILFAAAMIGLGIAGLVNGDFALSWQHVPVHHLPGGAYIAYACALIELATGIGLLFKPTLTLSVRILFPYLLLWVAACKLSVLVLRPLDGDSWGSLGEIAIMAAGGWCLFASHARLRAESRLGFLVGERGIRAARFLLIISLPMLGQVHLLNLEGVAGFVPAWLPYHVAWAFLTGVASFAAAAGMTFGVFPRLAATLETIMLGCITLFTWGALLDTGRTAVTAFLISAALTAGTWLVADTYRGVPWLARGRASRQISAL